MFPAGGDPAILTRKITLHDSITRDVLFAKKVVLCYRCKTWHMLGENCLVASSTQEDSGMSFSEQSDTRLVNQTSAESEPYAKLHPGGESQEESSALSEEIPSQENLLSRKDQFSPKETSPREQDNLTLQGNKLLNKNQNSKKSSNSIEPVSKELFKGNEESFQTLNHFSNPPTYKKWWHN